ncbi:MAG: rRNA maturation RNase YbeY [Spirochaetaceae bacterium]|jgi:probable rRNA maturation factor|nr:rRNA maturation RNase YbeY [Spirochaetaceae bacterium]
MNNVEVGAEDVPLPVYSRDVQNYCRNVMERVRLANRELSVLFCGNQFIQSLNLRYRGIDSPTDILSFPYLQLEGEMTGDKRLVPAGDIVISLEEMQANAEQAGIGAEEELRRLLIHGILHLAGFDHATNEASEPMLRQQEALLKELPPWTMTV